MADPTVIHSDLELFLTTWYAVALAARPESVCRGVEVGNSEPGGAPFPKRLLVIRDDGGPDTSILTGTRNVGLSVLADNAKDAADLAAIVHALRVQIPSTAPGNPVAAVLGSLGPYRVPESQPRARRYMTLTLGVVGTAL